MHQPAESCDLINNLAFTDIWILKVKRTKCNRAVLRKEPLLIPIRCADFVLIQGYMGTLAAMADLVSHSIGQPGCGRQLLFHRRFSRLPNGPLPPWSGRRSAMPGAHPRTASP